MRRSKGWSDKVMVNGVSLRDARPKQVPVADCAPQLGDDSELLALLLGPSLRIYLQSHPSHECVDTDDRPLFETSMLCTFI